MFGCTTPTSGGRLGLGNPDRPVSLNNLNRIERGFVQLTLAADGRREAAYRRLALTILGLDVPSLVQTLPLTRERSN
ncbi:MAG TPA: hypothetical protein VGJ60_28720 [Chloroflexota bacterium]|jgi:hypothetical protein